MRIFDGYNRIVKYLTVVYEGIEEHIDNVCASV